MNRNFHFDGKEKMRSMIPRGPSAATIVTVLMLSAVLVGCAAAERRDTRSLYDLGSPPTATSAAPAAKLMPVSIGEIVTPPWMDSSRMYYRLLYANPQEAHSYAHSRWTMSPARLFLQRLKSGIGAAGGAVLGAGEGGPDVFHLRIDADDFLQVFTAPDESVARVVMRATVLRDRRLVAQRTFASSAPAPTPDAAGGARALTQASDQLIADIIAWLATLPTDP